MKWPKSLRLRYSLRALLVFITLFMLWGGYHANRGWKQRAAEKVLGENGGRVEYERRFLVQIFHSRDVTAIYPGLVYALWGERNDVRGVWLHSSLEPKVVDALLALPKLPSLTLASPFDDPGSLDRLAHWRTVSTKTPLPPGALERILERHDVEDLHLSVWVLDDEACHALTREPTLTSLSIGACDISEERFAELLALPQLRSFVAACCPVTGDRLEGLPGSQSLERVVCLETALGQEFAAFVGRSPSVRHLQVDSVTVNDDFVTALGPHSSLDRLELSGGVITDNSADTFEQMPSLRGLFVPRGSLSSKAEAQLNHPRKIVVQR